MRNITCYISILLLCHVGNTWAADTVAIQQVEIHAPRTARIRQQSMPVQTLNRISIERLNVTQLSDAIKNFSGVTIKDYGGIGGLKTVSVRSLGATNTGVSYDGFMLSNEQNGQIDVGKLSLDNVQSVSLANGQSSNIFAPAKTFSSASLLSVETIQPHFSDSTCMNASASFTVGSFGLLSPSIGYQQKLGKSTSISINGEYQRANGEYPFTLNNGVSTEKLTRTNSDVESVKAEASIFSQLSSTRKLSGKVYLYNSERGLPGATTLYNPYSSQRLWDRQAFAQMRYVDNISEKFSYMAAARYSNTYTRYLDPDYLNIEGKLDNRYTQQEWYASLAGLYNIVESWRISVAADAARNSLDANLDNFAYPTRYSLWVNTAIQCNYKYVEAMANVLGQAFWDEVKYGSTPPSKQNITPTVALTYKPLGNDAIQVRSFYKKIFRMPTFNDLYYRDVGNLSLNPEQVQQFNIGVTGYHYWKQRSCYISISADAYRNYITDKIVAIPTKDIFIWSMMNLGKVEATGVDLSAKFGITLVNQYTLALEGSYSYQHSVDKTNRNSQTFNHQIAYTPRNSGSGSLSVETPYITLCYNLLWSGDRYALNQNINANHLPEYLDHSISARHTFKFRKFSLKASVEMLNMLNTQYEVVRNFPMPGRSFRASLSVII